MTEDEILRADQLARHVLGFSRDNLFLNLRFMDSAVSRLVPVPYQGGCMGTDTRHLYYDSRFVLRMFRENSLRITRIYLHSVLHCVFQHPYVGTGVRFDLWDLACDIAVEQMLHDLALGCVDDSCEAVQIPVLEMMHKRTDLMTAEKIYRCLLDMQLADSQYAQMQSLFRMDDHRLWYVPAATPGGGQGMGYPSPPGDAAESDMQDEGLGAMTPDEAKEAWNRLSRQIQVDLETFSKGQGKHAGHFLQNLKALHRERYDYADFLRKFSVYGEVMHIDDDTFDYSFYSYGIQLYGNMPLIEPLEYKDARRIREFVIAIDTSGSVQGETVQRFLQKTYNILKSQESFFSKINLHIIQCDAAVQENVKITTQEEFDSYLKTMQFHGFGGTDFRPVFRYVQELIDKKEFRNLKGLLYFTDGLGTYPQSPPPYQTAFLFLDDEMNNYEVPTWAMRVILETEDIMEE